MIARGKMVEVYVGLALMAMTSAAWSQGELISPGDEWVANRCELTWGEVPADAPAEIAGKPLLSVTIANDGDGKEQWPGVSLGLEDAPLDWSASSCLSCWVRVTSDDPQVAHKDISIVVYQQGLDKQQYRRHQVPVGRWALLRDDIAGYERSAVRRINVCMYETQTDRDDKYRWELAGLAPEQLTMLDGGWLSAWSGTSTARARAAAGGDGLRLVVEEAGPAKLALDGEDLQAAADLPSGFLARDCALEDAGWMEIGALAEAGLKLEYELEDGDRAVRVRGVIEDTTAQERAVSVCFALPVPAEGLTWWDDVRASRPVEAGEYANLLSSTAGARGQYSSYPLGCVTGGQVGGLALATRLDEPAVSRIVYDVDSQRLAVSFDFGLTPATTRFPSRAPFSFLIYRFDPAWGFRAATEKYVGMFPEFFLKRAMKEGIWMPFTDLATVENAEDFGFMFHEGNNNVPHDDEVGVYSFRYTEPMSWWMKMPKDMPREYDAAMELLPKVAGEDEGGHGDRARSMASSAVQDEEGRYHHAFRNTSWCDGALFMLNPDPELPTEGDIRNRGLLNYNMQHAEEQYGAAAQEHRAEPGPGLDGEYLDSLEMGARSVLNYREDQFAYCDVPLTFGSKSKRPCILQMFSTWEFTRFVSDDLHRRGRLLMANAVYSGGRWLAPLLDIGGTETGWLREGKYTPMSDARLNLNRWLSGQKPYLLLMNVDFHAFDYDMVRSYFKRSLFYGMHPSLFNGTWWDAEKEKWIPLRYWSDPELHNRDRDLFVKYTPIIRRVAEAGWEPMTYARSSDPENVWVERWGNYADGNLHFTVLNNSPGMKSTMVTLDHAALGIDTERLARLDLETGAHIKGDRLVAVDIVSGADVMLAWEDEKLERVQLYLQLSPQDCAAVRVGERADVGGAFLRDAAQALALHSRQETSKAIEDLETIVARLEADGYEDARPDLVEGALALANGTLKPLHTSAAEAGGAPDPKLRRDVAQAERLLTRGVMAAVGYMLFARVEGAISPGASAPLRLEFVNAWGTLRPRPSVRLALDGADTGAERASLDFAVPADAQVGDWLVQTPILRLSWPAATAAQGPRTLELPLHLELGIGVPFELKLEVEEASRQERRRRFLVRPVSFMMPYGLLVGQLTLEVPEGWQVDQPDSVAVAIPSRGANEFEFRVEIPPDAAPGLYEVRARLETSAGRPENRVSNAVAVFYAPEIEVPGENLAAVAAGAVVTVDSSYGGAYNAAPVTDGVRMPEPDVHWTEAAWASAERATEHWVEIELPEAAKIGRAVLWWPFDNGWLFTSRDFGVQYEAEGRWVDAATVSGNQRAVHTIVDFEPAEAKRWRVVQSKGGGPPKRPDLMWLGEVELYAPVGKGEEE